MKATLRIGAAALAAVAAVGCGGIGNLNPMGGGGGSGGGGAYKPTEVVNTMYTGDLADAKKGRWVTYASEASGQKTSQTVKIVGRLESGEWLIEQWMDMGAMAFGYLFRVGSDKKISKAWAAAKGDTSWTEIKVTEPPQGQAGDGPKPRIKESDEKKDVKAGNFSCRRLDVTVDVQGKDYTSASWFSKDVWKIYAGSEHGGLVATEASGSKTFLDGKGEDAAPTIELPSGK